MLARSPHSLPCWEGLFEECGAEKDSESGLRGSVDGSRVACSRYVWSEFHFSRPSEEALLMKVDRVRKEDGSSFPSLSFSTLKTLFLLLPLILVPIQSASVASPFKAMYCIYSRHPWVSPNILRTVYMSP